MDPKIKPLKSPAFGGHKFSWHQLVGIQKITLLFVHFVMITLSRIFTNRADDILLLRKDSNQKNHSNAIKSNTRNYLIALAQNLEALFLRQKEFIGEVVNMIVNSIATCCQKVRPNRSYNPIANNVTENRDILKRNNFLP
jgi:hypothetical protein